MLHMLQNVLLPRRFFEGTSLERRRSMLIFELRLMGLCPLLFYPLNQPNFSFIEHVYGASGYWVLLGLLRLRVPYVWVVNGCLLWSLLYIGYITVVTGGINSPAMVWMTVAVLPAILLLNRAMAVVWWLIAIFATWLLFYLCQIGWVSSNFNASSEVVGWTVTHKLFVDVIALYLVWLAERLHHSQVAEMEQNNAELEKVYLALMQAQAHKDEFIASVGHELRTPMNAILGLNGILRKELTGRSADVDVVDHIRRSTEQLLQVVNDILDFSQLQAGRLTLHEEEFGIQETLRALLAQYETKAKTKGIELSLDVSTVHRMWVKGDRQRLVQILKNLLENALKFTPKGSIQLRAQSVGGGVLFEVQDSGIGIAVDRQQQIFNSFEHADVQTNRQYGGTGLGLAICERLVKLQGGIIGVSSVLGQGSRFWFQLPLKSLAARQGQVAGELASALANQTLRILLVDDNAVNLLVARMMLKKAFPNADIAEADSGAVALEKLQAEHFDVVLMDVIMPVMSGLQATQTIRQNFPLPVCNIPILALTASANPVDAEECIASGMNGVLHKPLDEQLLISKISSALAAQARRERG
jgi:signal transduction histidine kinase/CheY-like chemotaxis protein